MHGPIIIYTRLPSGGTYYPICMFPTNSKCLIAFLMPFLSFVYGYPSSSPHAHCTPIIKSVPSLCYTHRHGHIYMYIQVHTHRHLPSAVPWICKDCLLWKTTCMSFFVVVEILLFVVVTGGDEACNTRVGVWFTEFAQHALHVLLPHDWPILCY